MRKVQKESIIEIANLLKKAQEHVKNLLKKQEYASVLDLLQQCQQGAIQIGTVIEQSEGEGFSTVKMLEEYCELVFQVFEMVQTNPDASDADVIFGAMDRLLADVSESISKDIVVRKEVVFLPYKASMWDSLESIWMAADADPECDAYVVPIPYYDKNPNGTAKEMHYEGELFPEYVPVTHYDNYNIEERHPDAIYIHNPYDETNFVTSVHPAFYSKRLKELTDCLVYIPYFVLEEINPKNKAAVKAMEHFVLSPGVIHAHKVVVQSEAMRQIYIDVMSETVGEKTRKYWEEKILGIGSPKFDKVHSTTKENIDVPQEWMKIIEKPDGEWKKIIFYNTNVGALLQHGEKMLDKMRDVFEVFKQNKEEVALLWRPHPLIKATIESMRPQLWEDYRKLVEEYKAEGWGIYDDTPDMDRAVALCDGYYGDGSSIVQLCQEAGKPVMLQNVSVRVGRETNDSAAVLFMEDFLRINDWLYFMNKDVNLVCRLHLNSDKIEILGSFPEEDFYAPRLSVSIVQWRNKLVFAPLKAKKIWIYDLDAKEWKGIARRGAVVEGNAFFKAFLYEDKVFMVGSDFPAILCLDMLTEKISYIEGPYRRLFALKEKVNDIFFRNYGVQKGSKLYLASCLDNYICEFDMDTLQHRWIQIGSAGNRYVGITWDGNCFWIAPRDGSAVFKWDGGENIKEYKLSQTMASDCKYIYGVICMERKIFFPGILGKCSFEFGIEDGAMQKIQDGYSCCKREDSGDLFLQTTKGEVLMCMADKPVKSWKCVIRKKDIKRYVADTGQKAEKNFEKIVETYVFGLSDFFCDMSSSGEENSDKWNDAIGNVIWKEFN